jgi:glutamyl-tRNA synthetase
MAPSPTGDMHVGSMAVLLKNYAFAKKHHGQFILRIEDTDQEREVPGATQRILDVIKAYGLDWDEGPDIGGPHGPYIQSERLQIYQEKAEELVKKGAAYYCFCSKERLEANREAQRAAKIPPKYDRYCRSLTADEIETKLKANEPHVIRLKVPDNQPVVFNDLIRGRIEINSDVVDDQVLLKSDGFPTYHLGVVVDDHMMEISHIMRGEEWISSTPKHVLLYQAFGWDQPIYAHIPVFLNPDGKGKMSKRKGTVSAQSFLDAGYLPEALLNFFMILGWTPADQREMITLSEYIQEFDPQDVSPKSVVFDLQKLDWINGVYIRQLSPIDLKNKIQPFLPSDFPVAKIDQILPLISERLVKLSDIEELTSFFYRPINIDQELLIKKADAALVTTQLQEVINLINSLQSFEVADMETAIRQLQEKNDWKKSQFFMMIRVAVTGKVATPPLFETMAVIGKAEILSRLNAAVKLVK